MLPLYRKRKTKKKELDINQPEKKKRKPDLVKKLDKVFSLYVRLRDVMPNGYFRCISCGKIKAWSDMDAGHFHGRTHMATRFEEDNVHGECTSCNRFSSDHIIQYRDNLIAKIGQSRYDKLRMLSKSTKHWLDSELEEKIDYYKREVKRLSAEKGINVKL